MTQQLSDKVYAITGGSQGFGLAIARSLVAQGARVGLLSRDPVAAQEAVTSIGHNQSLAVKLDIGDPSAIPQALATVKRHFGQLNGLINNAGVARPNTVEKLIVDEVLLQLNTNFLGAVFCCQAAIPLLRGSDNPRIINISSASAHHYDEMSHLSIYAATKAALERFSRDLSTELQVDGIGVTCIRPGNAWTNFANGWDNEALQAGVSAWKEAGAYMRTGMETAQLGEAVAFALAQPAGVAVDLLEIRPNGRLQK
jgi:NAD(P)-dependent dehydrogenase (short-subunit alcohol dehydrogenase family)